MKFLNKIYGFLSSPFQKNLGFFLFLFLLASSVNFFNRLYYNGISSGIFWSLFGYVECYLLCLLLPLLNDSVRRMYKGLLITFGLLNFIVDFVVSMISTNSGFNEFVGLILGTNLNEIYEFIQHYISYQMIVLMILCCIVIWGIFHLLRRIKVNRYVTIVNLLILIAAIPLVLKDTWGHSKNIFVGKLYTIVKEYNKNNHELRDYYSNPQLVIRKELPQNIVVVIGESFARDFSSLYGYDKPTNPKLSQLPDSSLVLYKNVTSGDVSTVENLEYIMSTFSHENCKKEWYECQTLIEILSTLNYRTYWISNQAKVGLWDNIPAKYGFLCDSTLFVGPQNGFNTSATFDENVILPTRNIMSNDTTRKALFVHLIGSHPGFQQRYPKDRAVFKGVDYPDYALNQRDVIAHYDNSLVYNDSVVNEIFNIGRDKEAVFFYFSDHGLDIYKVDSEYVGHGRRGNQKSEEIAKRIPFMIYATPLYQQKFPGEMKRMYESVDNEFVTENFIYSLMDLMGVRFEENDDVKKYSLFRNSVSEN